MQRVIIGASVFLLGAAIVASPSRVTAEQGPRDFGAFVASQLAAHSEQLFGFNHPLEKSASVLMTVPTISRRSSLRLG